MVILNINIFIGFIIGFLTCFIFEIIENKRYERRNK